MNKNPIRVKRVSDFILRTIAKIFQNEFADPRVGLLTVSHVSLSADLKNAKIFISFFDDHENKESIKILNSASGFFRKRLAESSDLRFVPQLRFVYDRHLAKTNRILALLDSCRHAG